ncbi:hypothetical protein F4808DRAFT_443684 [Astrocystis sublimbata]|nr:hypothetical protein F4808DRAFT_443684 [Astrocystis sublimbata]
MYRAAVRSAPRLAAPLRQSSSAVACGRRFASTVPADKRRSWKSSAVRWGLAAGVVYWYSTSTAFAEEPQLNTIQPPPAFSDEDLPTVDAVVARKRKEAEARAQRAAAAPKSKTAPEAETAALASQTSPEAPAKDVDGQEVGGPEALEQEAAQQGAFNPETGEINWDCPCLGGMADGPCGEQFKAAFSCFVYSTEEPKGMDCIDKFQHMQDCFRLHPEVYGDELADDDEAGEREGGAPTEDLALSRDAAPEGQGAPATTTQAQAAPAPASKATPNPTEPARPRSPMNDATEVPRKNGEDKSDR